MSGFVEVRFVGGSQDGQVKQWPSGMVHEGGEHVLPPRGALGAADSTAAGDPSSAGSQGETWERYVFSEGIRGWVARLAPGG
jgi:hypothetical protein